MLTESLEEGVTESMIWDFSYDSPQAIIQLLERYGFAMSKKFGQNFLISPSARQRIIDSLRLQESQRVWEIGPGIGALTVGLLESNVHVTAFEIDHGFCTILREEAFVEISNFSLVEGDVLKTWPEVYQNEGCPDVICGNLPYNVGSICIARFLEKQCLPERMVYTLQKEVGDRLSAKPGSKLWSTLSILAQIDYEVSPVCTIRGGAFFPPPNVDSVVIQMQKRANPLVPVQSRTLFLQVVNDLFTQRRKTVRNNLLRGKSGSMFTREMLFDSLEKAGIPESERAENLDFPALLSLVNALSTV
jgi:16S rRNA (adenine1518-N6/adenine1519-N6)-dimethyltransferase